jgi:hypothetical protein
VLNFGLTIKPELAPLIGRRADSCASSLALFEGALTAWLIGQQQRRGLADIGFAQLIGTTADDWRRLRAGAAHYSEDQLYVIAGRLPDGLAFVVDVARQQDGWSLYDTWLLWGTACLPGPVRAS